MEIHTILRQLNISLITDTPNPIIELFNDIWSKLSIVETDVYHTDGGEFIYFIDGEHKQWIFFQDNENERFWCNYQHYWSLFDANFNLKYVKIQALTKILVENALNNRVTTPYMTFTPNNFKVENVLNNRVTTPLMDLRAIRDSVENALNILSTQSFRQKLVDRKLNSSDLTSDEYI